MGKDYYDDMQDRSSRRSTRDSSGTRPNRGWIWTIVLGIAICVVVIVIWYQFFPAQQQQRQNPQAIVVQEVLPQAQRIVDAPTVGEVEATEQTTAAQIGENPALDAPVLDNQARSLTERTSVQTPTSSKTIQYADHRVAEGEDLS